MSYQVLARKWRPQVFEDVVGQGHITRTLQNAIATKRLAHAFLFSGPRGVGKTTTARILAKALNCKEGPTPTPCGKCDPCIETAAGTSVDVIEIDGASNRGIEHIRELREAVKYAPVGGKYKVYVIDEVHMLTNEAFNALLKTLEEPPPHVIFIFATTEPQKIPATIHSRCQRYGFKRISLHEITAKLREIAGEEGIKVSDQGLAMIARAAEGSMRDSQSLLDQAVSFSGMEINDEDLQTILGTVAQETLMEFTGALLAKDAAALLRQVDALLEQGQDMRQFLSGAVEHLRNLLVAKIAADPGQIIELPAADIETIKKQAAGAAAEQILMLFDSLSRTLDEMRWSPHQRFTLEAGLIKACSLAPLKPLSEVLERMRELEERLGSGARGAAQFPDSVREKPSEYSSKVTSRAQQASAPSPSPKEEHADIWNRILSAVKAKRPSLASILNDSTLMDSSADSLVVGIKGNGFQMGQVEKKENRSLIEQIASEALDHKVRVKFQLFADDPKNAPKPSSSKKPVLSSSKEPDLSASKEPAAQKHDPLAQDVAKLFGGEVVDSGDTDTET